MSPEATGRHEVREGQDTMVLTRSFRAPIEDVWAAVTEPDRMARWIGTWGGDPGSGSVQFRMTAEGEDVVEQPWQIRACEPPHTLVVRSADDSGVWDLGIHLSQHDGVTTLEFTQVIHDPAALESTGPGWEYYLDRLVAAETGGEVSSIDFEPGYYPALSGHYAELVPHDVVVSTWDENAPVPARWTESTVYADMWVDPDDDPREVDAGALDERGILLDYLRRYRLTLEMKCAGLSSEQLARRSVPPSTMSLLGLMRHVAEEERHLRRVMAGENEPKLYCTDEDRDGDWNGATDDPAVVEDAWRQWRTEMELTDRYLAGASDLGAVNAGVSDLGPDGADLQLRDILVAQIAEYARHCGHADLLRERIDGRVGQ